MSTNYPTPDAQQLAAIRHRGGAKRIMAAAGTGKSTTITLLVKGLIEDGVSPSSILLTTFTRKGAESVVQKLTQFCGPVAAKAITVGTFHKIATQEMIAFDANHSSSPEKRRWHVLDEDDSEEFWTRAAREIAADMLSRTFDSKNLFSGTKAADKELEGLIKSLWKPMREIRSFQINMNRHRDDFGDFAAERLQQLSGAYRTLLAHSTRPSLRPYFRAVLKTYEDMKRLNGGKDYDDLLFEFNELLRTNQDYRLQCRRRWAHVIVDEYQDTCHLQDQIISLLNTENLVCVGDVNQSIYAWRSAVPELMISFRKRYNAADFPLEYNYRSKDEILDVANEVLRQHHDMLQASGNYGEKDLPLLQLRGVRGKGGAINFIDGYDQREELDRVYDRISRLLLRGVEPSQICVLSRVSYYSTPLEGKLRSLKKNGLPLPIQVWGGRSLLDSKTAKEMLAVFKAAIRPADEYPFLRLATLLQGVGDVAATNAFFRSLFCLPVAETIQPLIDTLDKVRGLVSPGKCNATNLLAAIEEARLLLEDIYASDPKMSEHDKRQRKNELDALTDGMRESIESFESTNGSTISAADLINQFSLDPKRDRNVPGALTISTVHAAKGLEWDYVFLIGANEGTLPIIRKKDENAEIDPATKQAALEEECRILYVALTRAKEFLGVSFQPGKMSRFLASSPLVNNYLRKLNLAA